MIQDIEPKKLYNEYAVRFPGDEDYITIFRKNSILVREVDGCIGLPRFLELLNAWKQQLSDRKVYQYLFCIDKDAYFLYPDFDLTEESLYVEKINFKFMKVSQVRYQANKELCFAIYTAFHLYQWYENNKFCGRCAAKLKPDTKERMLYCDQCGNQVYPKIAPAIIVAVTNGEKLLLTKYANRDYKQYALIAGFTEIGETAEDTVRREVMEEVGLRVKNIRYYKTQPWGIDGNLLLGYFAELDGDDTVSVDTSELSTAEWVHREKLKNMDDSVSLTREMIHIFSKGITIPK